MFFSWFLVSEQPIHDCFVRLFSSFAVSRIYTSIHSHIYLTREHGHIRTHTKKKKSWCCMPALSHPVDYYFREASEKMIIVVRSFVRLVIFSARLSLSPSVHTTWWTGKQTHWLLIYMCVVCMRACLCLQSYEQTDVFSLPRRYTQRRIVITAAAAI